MKAVTTVALTASGIAAAMAAQAAEMTPRQNLLDRGFKVVAEGYLIEAVECREATWTTPVIGWTDPYLLRNEPCRGHPKYGAYQRLKNDDSEFVCVSFRDWACYSSHAQN
jgi:hypothetical protein